MSSGRVGLRVIAVLLAWQAVGGIWRAALALRFQPTSIGPLLFPVAQMAEAAAAGLTAAGLWRARRWAAKAYIGWALLALIAHAPLTEWISLLAIGPSGSQRWSWLLPAAIILLAGGVLYVGWRYIRHELNRQA